jgi:hypothetical protein
MVQLDVWILLWLFTCCSLSYEVFLSTDKLDPMIVAAYDIMLAKRSIAARHRLE